MHHVVVIGAGFGGLYAARALRRAAVQVTVVDRRNHHLFQPLLYQVATAALNPSDIAAPIRSILRKQKNATVVLGEVSSIDRGARRVVLSDGASIPYDSLIVATGATHSYFGRDDWAEFAPGLKTIEDALDIRRRILLAYEAAERETDRATQAALMTFIVVGAGPTGVELAGALAEIARHSLARDFRKIDTTDARVVLLEGLPQVLPSYPPALAESAARQLASLGVEVRTGARVTAIDAWGVSIGDERIAARTVLWAAGVKASHLLESLRAPLDRAGRVIVEATLTIPGDPRVFVIGDASATKQSDGSPVPGVAPAAIQEGRHAAKAIERSLLGLPLQPFAYRDKGSLATIGRAAGVADLPTMEFGGFFAWLAWLMIHIFFLIGFRNRVLVILQWAWAYVTYQRGARLITGVNSKYEP